MYLSSFIKLLFILMALPFINLRISLFEVSSFVRIIKSTIFKFFLSILIDGKLDPEEFSEKTSLAAFLDLLASFSP